MMIEDFHPARRAALLVAHPGHELHLYGWMRRERPICMVLATGSRSGGDLARLQASAAIVEGVGAHPSKLFGAVLDRDFYAAVLAGDIAPFLRWKDLTVDILVSNHVERLVLDGWQLYSVTHDLTHVIGRIAANEASHRLGHPIEVLHADVVPASLGGAVPVASRAYRLVLSDDELAQKQIAIDGYPDIALEVAEIRALGGDALGRTEALFRPPPLAELLMARDAAPRYESFGESRRAAGIYNDVIRWRHVEKIVEGLLRQAPN